MNNVIIGGTLNIKEHLETTYPQWSEETPDNKVSLGHCRDAFTSDWNSATEKLTDLIKRQNTGADDAEQALKEIQEFIPFIFFTGKKKLQNLTFLHEFLTDLDNF